MKYKSVLVTKRGGLEAIQIKKYWARLFEMLGEGKSKLIIVARFPVLEAARAYELLGSGQVAGNIVLLAAASMIAKGLEKKGGSLLALPEGFLVTGKQRPLKDSELERAAYCAGQLLHRTREQATV